MRIKNETREYKGYNGGSTVPPIVTLFSISCAALGLLFPKTKSIMSEIMSDLSKRN